MARGQKHEVLVRQVKELLLQMVSSRSVRPQVAPVKWPNPEFPELFNGMKMADWID